MGGRRLREAIDEMKDYLGMGMGGSFAKTKEAQAAMVTDGNLPSKLEGRNSFVRF